MCRASTRSRIRLIAASTLDRECGGSAPKRWHDALLINLGRGESGDPTLTRLGAFSDGVFAFAITLLILAIRIPHPGDADASHGLLALLTAEWRSWLAYFLSFMLVGINWANHRVMFSTFARGDHVLVWLNLLYLMLAVAIIPIPTAVLGAWLGSSSHGNQVVAAVFYGLTATVGAIAYNILWFYGAFVGKLNGPAFTARERRAHTAAWLPAPFITGALTLVSFLSPVVAIVGYVAVIFLYVLPLPRLIAFEKARRLGSTQPTRPRPPAASGESR